mgnify:CR=1 FL=1
MVKWTDEDIKKGSPKDEEENLTDVIEELESINGKLKILTVIMAICAVGVVLLTNKFVIGCC